MKITPEWIKVVLEEHLTEIEKEYGTDAVYYYKAGFFSALEFIKIIGDYNTSQEDLERQLELYNSFSYDKLSGGIN